MTVEAASPEPVSESNGPGADGTNDAVPPEDSAAEAPPLKVLGDESEAKELKYMEDAPQGPKQLEDLDEKN